MAEYEHVLRALAQNGASVLFCEECEHGVGKSIAEIVADSLGHPYQNIDMSVDERAKRGIPLDYAAYPDDMSCYPPEQIRSWHAEREAYMLDMIEEVVAALRPDSPAQLIVICGSLHLESLADALESRLNTPVRRTKLNS